MKERNEMIKTILKVVTLGGAGYTVGKFIHDDEFRDDFKDKVSSLFCNDEPKDTVEVEEEEDTPNDETKQIPYLKE